MGWSLANYLRADNNNLLLTISKGIPEITFLVNDITVDNIQLVLNLFVLQSHNSCKQCIRAVRLMIRTVVKEKQSSVIRVAQLLKNFNHQLKLPLHVSGRPPSMSAFASKKELLDVFVGSSEWETIVPWQEHWNSDTMILAPELLGNRGGSSVPSSSHSLDLPSFAK